MSQIPEIIPAKLQELLLELTKVRTIDLVRPKSLFHYTTAEGLYGILNSKRLWASHIFYLNDAMEFKYAVKLLKDEARARLLSQKDPLGAVGQL
jgi:hypothetical protein